MTKPVKAPTSKTTGDFWKMIWEQKSAAIVMLTELEEDRKVIYPSTSMK